MVLAQLLSALKKEFSKEMESVEANKVSITTKGTRSRKRRWAEREKE